MTKEIRDAALRLITGMNTGKLEFREVGFLLRKVVGYSYRVRSQRQGRTSAEVIRLEQYGPALMGSPGSVDLHNRVDYHDPEEIAGFFHTHPPGCAQMSGRDIDTMKQQLLASPHQRLYCLIECEGDLRAWIFYHATPGQLTISYQTAKVSYTKDGSFIVNARWLQHAKVQSLSGRVCREICHS